MWVLRATAGTLLETIFPAACIACHAPIGPRTIDERGTANGLLCPECRALLRPINTVGSCEHCGSVPMRFNEGKTTPGYCIDCDGLPRSFLGARSAFPYDSPAGAIVRNMKYQRSPFLAEWLAELSLAPAGGWLSAVAGDAIMGWVPLTLGRQLSRGFNQAQQLAEALGKKLDRPVMQEGVLLRETFKNPQARYRTREERMKNLTGCFRVKCGDQVRNRRVVLVDDVMTTGATLASAAEALRIGGASEVFLFTPVRAKFGEDADEAAK